MFALPGVSDAHAHLNPIQFPTGLDQVVANARVAGLAWIINVAMLRDGADQALQVSAAHADFMRTVVGCHPHDASHWGPAMAGRLEEMASLPGVVGLGEMGLDFFRNNSPRAEQEKALAEQLEMAARLEKPFVIHDRQAHDRCLEIINAHARLNTDRVGMFHCFSGGVDLARRVLDMGFIVSVPGVVTFPKATELHEVAAFTPLDRLVVETDCPFLAPKPHRGKRNEPAFVAHTALRVAGIRGMEPTELAAATTANLERLFDLPSRDAA